MSNLPTVLILAGGSGTRFWPMTSPKEQFLFFGQPLLFHNLSALARVGFTNVIVVGSAQEKDFVSKLTVSGLSIQFAVQESAKGMADAVLAAKSQIVGKSVLVMNADDVVEDSLYKTLVEECQKNSAFVVGREVHEYFDGGYLVQKDGVATGIVEKPGAGKEPSSLVNLVYHFFPDMDVFVGLLEKTKSSEDNVYEKALEQYFTQAKVRVVSYAGKWSPLKYPWHVLDILDLLFVGITKHMGKNVQIKNNVVIEGEVWIGDNVKIFENTKIIGPCYIGDNSIIGNNSMIRESHLGRGCITGFNTDVTRSYMGDNCWFHSNYVGDSVLEGNISMGSGAVLANLRLDEGPISSVVKGKKVDTKRLKLGAMISRDVRVGVNTSVMPGVKVGKNSFIGSGITLDADVPDDSFCVGETNSYTVKKNTKSIHPDARETFKKSL